MGVAGPEQRPVDHVHGKAHAVPGVAAGHGFAQQLHVVVIAGEHALVDRLLEGPDRRSHGTADGAAQCPGAIDAQSSRPQTVTGAGVSGYAK